MKWHAKKRYWLMCLFGELESSKKILGFCDLEVPGLKWPWASIWLDIGKVKILKYTFEAIW